MKMKNRMVRRNSIISNDYDDDNDDDYGHYYLCRLDRLISNCCHSVYMWQMKFCVFIGERDRVNSDKVLHFSLIFVHFVTLSFQAIDFKLSQ